METSCDLKMSNLNISNGSGEAGLVISAEDARYYRKGRKYYVFFNLDGDKCHIEFDESEFLYKRQGELTYNMRLQKGSATAVDLKTPYGQMKADYLVHTYDADIGDDRIVICIDYSSAGEEHRMRVVVDNINKQKE